MELCCADSWITLLNHHPVEMDSQCARTSSEKLHFFHFISIQYHVPFFCVEKYENFPAAIITQNVGRCERLNFMFPYSPLARISPIPFFRISHQPRHIFFWVGRVGCLIIFFHVLEHFFFFEHHLCPQRIFNISSRLHSQAMISPYNQFIAIYV